MTQIPDLPTRENAEAALALLDGLLDEFAFKNDDLVSRSSALSMLVTAVVRGAMTAAPMHVITKPEAGTGGSYLQDLVAAIAIGERCPVVSLSGDPREDEKRLSAAAMTGQPIIAMDNVSTTLMGDFLCQLIQRPMLQVRPLGRSDLITIANSAFVIGNGNNLTVGADAVRRTIQIALDANMENPETRVFRRDPVAEVLQDRGRYVGAALTLVRAYIVAGSPGRLPGRPSFEQWSDLVRSPLVWLKRPDPVQSVASVQSKDPVHAAAVAVFEAWAGELQFGLGYFTAELVKAAEELSDEGERARAALWEAFYTVGTAKGQLDPHKLSKWLSANENRVVSGFKLMADRSNKVRPRWNLVRLTKG